MKNIEIDEELYQFIAANTQFIGESASSILRRLLSLPQTQPLVVEPEVLSPAESVAEPLKAEPTATQVTSATKINEIDIPVIMGVDSSGSVFDYINKEELAMQRGAVGRFLLILAALYRVHHQTFSQVTEVRGRDRLYFAHSEEELAASGSSTKPRLIPDSPFWVITNSNTTRKKMMLTEAALALGYNETQAEKIRELL